MITAIKQQLLTNWHPMRWVALVLGMILVGNWILYSAAAAGLLGLFFLFQALTNTGCMMGSCTGANCYSASAEGDSAKDGDKEVIYEEVRNK